MRSPHISYQTDTGHTTMVFEFEVSTAGVIQYPGTEQRRYLFVYYLMVTRSAISN